MAKKRENLSLDVYLRFFLSREQDLLTLDVLRQIVQMHGYRTGGIPRKGVTATVSKLDLMDPSRSTLKENISSLAIISVEDIVADLNQLNWQECCVTSLQTFNSCEQALSAVESYDSRSTMKRKKDKSESRSHTPSVDRATSSSCTSESNSQSKKTKFGKNPNKEVQHLDCVPLNLP